MPFKQKNDKCRHKTLPTPIKVLKTESQQPQQSTTPLTNFQPPLQESLSVAIDLVDRQEAVLNKIIQAKDEANDALISKIQRQIKKINETTPPPPTPTPTVAEIEQKITDNNKKIGDLKKAKKQKSKMVKFERLTAGRSSVAK